MVAGRHSQLAPPQLLTHADCSPAGSEGGMHEVCKALALLAANNVRGLQRAQRSDCQGVRMSQRLRSVQAGVALETHLRAAETEARSGTMR
jgi:hypothetical protein